MSSSPEALEVLSIVAVAADEALAEAPVALDVSEQLALADIFFIVTADNPRHLRSIVEAVTQSMKLAQSRLPNVVEGDGESTWIVVDYGDLVVHAFLEEERDFYSLEKLWDKSPRLPLPSGVSAKA